MDITNVSFQNNLSDTHHFVIWDEEANAQVWEGDLNNDQMTPPLTFQSSDGQVGNASYQKDGGSKTYVSQILSGSNYLMN